MNNLLRFFSLRNQLILSASFSTVVQIKANQCTETEKRKQKFFKFASTMIPHPEKAYKGGEDALYHDSKILAVADGVGGWADHGVDPGLYSKELCKHIGEFFLENKQQFILKPKELIIKAHKSTKAIGSTTVCVLTIDNEEFFIRTANIGDSGYAIYRRQEDNTYQTVFKSREQQKGFNFPYQIGSEGDSPTCAQEEQHEVRVSDIIVVGTDGLFDNLSETQIRILLDEDFKQRKNVDLKRMSDVIANYAYKLSLDQRYTSPFARSAKQYGYNFMGGKSDDITVIVAEVSEGIVQKE